MKTPKKGILQYLKCLRWWIFYFCNNLKSRKMIYLKNISIKLLSISDFQQECPRSILFFAIFTIVKWSLSSIFIFICQQCKFDYEPRRTNFYRCLVSHRNGRSHFSKTSQFKNTFCIFLISFLCWENSPKEHSLLN